MEFLHFGLLPWFLPLAAIPIVLHLLTLHRLKTVELSTFRFLFDSYVQQRRRMKFLEALIALLRTAFLLFLVLAVARPVIKHWDSLFGGAGGSGRDVVLMIDASASMGTTTDGVTAISRAKWAATEVLAKLSADDRVTVVRVASKPKELCSRFSSDSKSIESEIESIDVSPSRANLFAAFSQVFGPESDALKNPVVYLFSDQQETGWGEFEAGQTDGLVPEGTELFVVTVGSNQDVANLAITGGEPDIPRAIAGLPITLRPELTNFSREETQDVTVTVLIDEKEVARQTLSLKPRETSEAEFVYTPTQPGVVRGRYEIEADRFTNDDTFLFTLDVIPRIRVILVNGNPAVEPLENAGLYLRAAMTSTDAIDDGAAEDGETKEDSTAVMQREFLRSVDVVDIPEASLNAEVLVDADVVILANCGAFANPDQFAPIVNFVASGGGLLILPGDKVNPDVYNQHFLPAVKVPDEQLASIRLAAAEGDPNDSASLLRLGAIDFAHPVLAVFSDSDQRYLTGVHFYRRFPLQFEEDRGNTWPLMEFADGSPALVESGFGDGKVIISAFPFHTQWGNLPMKPEFVPLVVRMIGHVKRRSDVEGPSVVPAEGSAEFVVNQAWAPASGKVTDIAGRVTPLKFQRSNSRLMAAFDGTIERGFYTVEVNGGRPEQPKQAVVSFAVNQSSEESDFTTLTETQLTGLLPGVKVTSVDASAEAQQLYGSIGSEQEIWRPLIVVLFVIIGIEFLLSTLGGQLADGEEDSSAERIRNVVSGRWVGRMTGANLQETVESSVH
jgi:hypothetical protein